MQFKLFSIPATGNAESEEELNRFLRSHRAVSVQKELINGHTACWCFCVEYLLNSPLPEGKTGGGGRQRVDYKEILSAEDFALFVRLREARKQLAATEAIPVYAVCTNEQLAEMVKGRAAKSDPAMGGWPELPTPLSLPLPSASHSGFGFAPGFEPHSQNAEFQSHRG